MNKKMRIYIGGLGLSVQEDDLKKIFTSPQLGTVESVEIIRSKGRSFGYLEFIPASDKGLAKLFSTYNGCMWKGGRLKLEKAKENYLSRLQREWEEEAEIKNKESNQDADEDESVHKLKKLKKLQDIEKLQLKIFFPKLRKIKPLPLKGIGKHKYSFQRVEVPPLPIHFCDCEQHSGLSLPKRNSDAHETNDRQTGNQGLDIYEVNENERNMMMMILDNLLEKKSEKFPDDSGFTAATNNDVIDTDNGQFGNKEEDEISDEDDLLINMTSQTRKRAAVFDDWGHRTMGAKNQDYFLRDAKSSNEPNREMHVTKKGRLLPDKKRKQSDENLAKVTVSFEERKPVTRVQHGGGGETDVANTQPTGPKLGSIELNNDSASSRKSAWKDLVREKGSSAFRISDILTANPEAEIGPQSENPAVAPGLNEQDEQSDQSTEYEESQNVPIESTKPSSSNDKIARGAAWQKKSSWLELVGDARNIAFSIGQILPSVTFDEQSQKSKLSKPSSEQHNIVNGDQESPIGCIGEPQGRIIEDGDATEANPNVDDLGKGPNHTSIDEQPNSDPKQSVERKDEALAPLSCTSSLLNHRALGDFIISETCPFMRSDASMKEWSKTKAALSVREKKVKGKVPVQD